MDFGPKKFNLLLQLRKNIYIGTSKEYLDSRFGPPMYTGAIEDYHECAYVTKNTIIRTFFDKEYSGCVAYLITCTSDNFFERVKLPEMYSWIAKEKSLNHISFYDIVGAPLYVCSVFSANGAGRTYYFERYWFSPGEGNYYNYYFGYTDYGYPTIREDAYVLATAVNKASYNNIDDEVSVQSYENNEEHYYDIMIDRKHNYANSFGISAMDTEELDAIDLFTYTGTFDSLQLRGRGKFLKE